MNLFATHAVLEFDSEAITEVPHQDGPPNIALQRVSDGFYATLGTGAKVVTFKQMGTPGADERFIAAGNVYVAVRAGAPALAFAKSGPWT